MKAMEQVILEIINNKYKEIEIEWCHNPAKNTAKEITAHVFEFIEWTNGACESNDKGKWLVYALNYEDDAFKTKEELYQYWINNIYNGKED